MPDVEILLEQINALRAGFPNYMFSQSYNGVYLLCKPRKALKHKCFFAIEIPVAYGYGCEPDCVFLLTKSDENFWDALLPRAPLSIAKDICMEHAQEIKICSWFVLSETGYKQVSHGDNLNALFSIFDYAKTILENCVKMENSSSLSLKKWKLKAEKDPALWGKYREKHNELELAYAMKILPEYNV